MEKLKPDATGIYVAAHQAPGAILEAIEAEVPLIVAVAEHIPIHDMMRVCLNAFGDVYAIDTALDNFHTQDTVKVSTCRRQLSRHYIRNRPLQNRLPASTMFQTWEGGNCREIRDTQLRG